MMGWEMGFGWGGMVFGGLMMFVFWGGLIALIVLAIRGFTNMGNTTNRGDDMAGLHRPPNETPLDIVQARYARGEIDKDEYEAISHDLLAT